MRERGQITLALVEMENKIRGQCVYLLTESNIMSIKHTRKKGSPAKQEVPSATKFTGASVNPLLSPLSCDDGNTLWTTWCQKGIWLGGKQNDRMWKPNLMRFNKGYCMWVLKKRRECYIKFEFWKFLVLLHYNASHFCS